MLRPTPKPAHPKRGRGHHEENRPSLPLGCFYCCSRKECGGLRVKDRIMDCLSYCCGNPEACDLVCRNNAEVFVKRIQEVGTLSLSNVPRAQRIPMPSIPDVIPIFQHGNRRTGDHPPDTIAISLSKLFYRRTGNPKFSSATELRSALKLDPLDRVIVTGTAQDPLIEPWWGIGEQKRRAIIRNLKVLGIELATTPNFSLFTQRPRWDDMHSMKRIALVHSEFLQEGLPCALHVNGRTDRDMERWAEYVRDRDEVSTLAYEFTTGAKWKGRRELHMKWLANIADKASRPLDLIIRGGTASLPELRNHFRSVTLLEATSFMHAMKRKIAIMGNDGKLKWHSHPTPPGQNVDSIVWTNITAARIAFSDRKIAEGAILNAAE